MIAPCHSGRKCRQRTSRGHKMYPCHVDSYLPTAFHQSWKRPTRKYHSVASFSPAIPARQRQINLQYSQSTRLFGCKPDSPNAKPGHIFLSDDREDGEDPSSSSSTIPINLTALQRTIETTRDIIGYPTYDVSVTLVDESYMQEINLETRDMDKSTDVLSFCFDENFVEPGVLGEVEFDIADYYNLGDMLLDVEYVKKRCEEDRKRHAEEKEGKEGGGTKNDGMIEGEVISEQIVDSSGNDQHDDEEDDEYEYEYIEVEVDEYDDRGVAPAMQYVYDPEIRIHMLIVHGMLHLVGYDHIEDDDYELMVVREDEVLAELRKRLGDDFGVAGVVTEGDAK
eukprot:CAMPEP_0172316140 /NCGR_PEP_ID=MMETSP1058-20130122/27438_1 /TAXON_ID=83371 /ORGANISM="Detonula confervacea, Strain CCMP 353" /LENGTH=337 /DNA_ID=CAMNT_0013030395 /DNA_START=122 /DNA_END=1135 /DNA_ORIENTATION=+